MATVQLFPIDGPHAKVWEAFRQLVVNGPDFRRIYGKNAHYWEGSSPEDDVANPANQDEPWVRMTPEIRASQPVGMSTTGQSKILNSPMAVKIEVVCPGTRARDALNLYYWTIHNRVFPETAVARNKIEAMFQSLGAMNSWTEQPASMVANSGIATGSILFSMWITG